MNEGNVDVDDGDDTGLAIVTLPRPSEFGQHVPKANKTSRNKRDR